MLNEMPVHILLLYIFGVIGVCDTLYLIWHKVRGTDVACVFFPKEWCRKVQYAPQSKTLGIPNAILGFVMYACILCLTALYVQGVVPFWPIQIIVGIGFLFSMYFTYIQAFVLRAFCTWCVLSAVNFIIMAAAVFM